MLKLKAATDYSELVKITDSFSKLAESELKLKQKR